MSKIKIRKADMFSFANRKTYLVNPTNIGWTRSGENTMGAGLAKDFKKKYEKLALRYGMWCKMMRGKLYIDMEYRTICAPSKGLNEEKPWLSWQGKSDFETIRSSYSQLSDLSYLWSQTSPHLRIICPLLGIGNGKLPREEVLEIVERINWTDNVIFVEK